MTDELEALRDGIVAAVQQELTRHGQQVAAEVQRLHEELAGERAARSNFEEQVNALAGALEQAQSSNTTFQTDLQRALEKRLGQFGEASKRRHEDMDARIGRVVQEANVGIASAVEAASRPILKQLEHRQDAVETSIETLDQNLRKFDDQAARMVTHFNNVTAEVDGRMNELSRQVASDLDERLTALVNRVDEVAALGARQETEVAALVTTRVDQTEDRINERIMTTEARLNEEIGSRVADIDAHLGRVSSGLDDTVAMLSERIGGAEAKFAEMETQIAEMADSVSTLDSEAMEEMQEKVSAAAGEAVLVRIELERFQKVVEDQHDKTTIRVTELETSIQEQHMDVEAAVQLERLEEVERAVIALDPSQFVRKDATGAAPGAAVTNPPDEPSATTLAPPTAEPTAAPLDAPAAPIGLPQV